MSGRYCPACKCGMRMGIAMGMTCNAPRRGESQVARTIYPSGPGYVKPCLKCPRCGHSEEISKASLAQGLENALQGHVNAIKDLLKEANKAGLKVHNAPKVSSHDIHITEEKS